MYYIRNLLKSQLKSCEQGWVPHQQAGEGFHVVQHRCCTQKAVRVQQGWVTAPVASQQVLDFTALRIAIKSKNLVSRQGWASPETRLFDPLTRCLHHGSKR